MTIRTVLSDFALENTFYAGATITVWQVDASLAKTATLATLYSAMVGGTTLQNPQSLNSRGKVEQPIYVDRPVIYTISLDFATADSGVVGLASRWRSAWATGTLYYGGERLLGPAGDASYVVMSTHTSGTFATDLANGLLEIEIDLPTATYVTPEDYGAVGDDASFNNQPAFQAMFDALKAAGGGRIELPPKDYYMVGVETPSLGVYSAVGTYGRQAVYLKDASNITMRGAGPASRLIRTDIAQAAQDKYSQHILLHNCSGIDFSGFTCVGLQDDGNVDTGTGSGIHCFRGTHGVSLNNLYFQQCGAGAAIMLGDNRITGATPYDLTAPVYDIDIGNITVQNSRYFCVVNIARDVRIKGWRHFKATHAGVGTPQSGHIRRSLYLLGCRDVQFSGGRIRGAHKVAVFFACYPSTRSLGDLKNVVGRDVQITGATDVSDADNHTALRFDDTNTNPAAITRFVNIDLSGIQIDNHVAGIYYDGSGNTTGITTTKMIEGLRISNLGVKASTVGIDLSSAQQFKDVSVSQFDVEVLTANAAGGAPTVGFRISNTTAVAAGASATEFHTPVSLSGGNVRSGNRAMHLLGLQNPTLIGVTSAYVADGVSSPQTTDLRLEAGSGGYSPDFRLRGSGTWQAVSMVASPVMLSLALTSGDDGVNLGATGFTTSRSAVGYRVHWTMHNPNGAVGTIGTNGSGLEFRCGIANATSRLTDSSGNKLVEWGQSGGSAALGFYGATAIAKPTGVAVSAAGVHAALVSLGLISA